MSPKDLGGQAMPSTKNNAEGIILPDFWLYIGVVIKTGTKPDIQTKGTG